VDNEYEALRAATTPKATCGWGCFCDACWLAAGEAEKQHLGRRADDALGAELAVYDSLWRLAFGEPGSGARCDQEG
jgi:hypothetical protein